MKIIVAGGTGFIGKPLVEALNKAGHSIVILSRYLPENAPAVPAHITQPRIVEWDGKTIGVWGNEIDRADAIINLAGEPIAAKRWTASQKKKIEESRVNATAAIVAAIGAASRRPRVLINGSAVGYYGNVDEETVTERRSPAHDFLGTVCMRWEREAVRAEEFGARVVLLRTGIVLEKDGGALKKMMLPFQLFAGGPIGSGKQWMPWIHRDDLIRIILFSLEANVHGAVNAAAPEPVRMKEFASSLGKAMRRPSWAPVPGFILKVALGEMSEMLLGGQKAVPAKLLDAGFKFSYSKLESALNAIFRQE